MFKNRKSGLFFEIFKFILSRDVPGQRIVPGFLLLPLSRDKGTPGQEFFLSWDKGTPGKDFFLSQDKGTMGRPIPCDVPSRGNTSLY